ncbi:DNA-binding transcriptional regulator, LysR family [Lachnospiraceae bacterium XBB1006]|nr:DNA-binding transcriptional regulator, LysR family [Lachnospiraceae bacterium XBB1006]
MTLRHFKIYTTVYEERNMTAAAQKLYMSQPSVSQAVKELEKYYDVVLFERFPKGLKSTEAGDTLYEYASNILDMNTELADMMKKGVSQQILRVGSNDTAGVTLLDSLLQEYTLNHSIDQVKVQVNRSVILADMLRTNELDIILTDEFTNAPDLYSEVICRDEFVVVASPDYPGVPKDYVVDADFLIGTRLLLRESGTDERDFFEQYMKSQGYLVIPFWESISFDILKNAAVEKMGITVLPSQCVKNEIADGRLVKLQLPDFQYYQSFILAWQKNKYLSVPIIEFVNLCRKIAK